MRLPILPGRFFFLLFFSLFEPSFFCSHLFLSHDSLCLCVISSGPSSCLASPPRYLHILKVKVETVIFFFSSSLPTFSPPYLPLSSLSVTGEALLLIPSNLLFPSFSPSFLPSLFLLTCCYRIVINFAPHYFFLPHSFRSPLLILRVSPMSPSLLLLPLLLRLHVLPLPSLIFFFTFATPSLLSPH